jgi:hypothetical protein
MYRDDIRRNKIRSGEYLRSLIARVSEVDCAAAQPGIEP